jgi:hypothetical protein
MYRPYGVAPAVPFSPGGMKVPGVNEEIGKKPVSVKEKLPPPVEVRLMVEKSDVVIPLKLNGPAFDSPAPDGSAVIVTTAAASALAIADTLSNPASAVPLIKLVQSFVRFMIPKSLPLLSCRRLIAAVRRSADMIMQGVGQSRTPREIKEIVTPQKNVTRNSVRFFDRLGGAGRIGDPFWVLPVPRAAFDYSSDHPIDFTGNSCLLVLAITCWDSWQRDFLVAVV